MRMHMDDAYGQDGPEPVAEASAQHPEDPERGPEDEATTDEVPDGEEIDVLRGRVAPDPARIADGWTPRFVVGPDRLEEVLRLYRELGFEAVADPIRPPDMEDDCRDCRLLVQLRFRYVYTRGGAPR